jgi:hypothetical protein
MMMMMMMMMMVLFMARSNIFRGSSSFGAHDHNRDDHPSDAQHSPNEFLSFFRFNRRPTKRYRYFMRGTVWRDIFMECQFVLVLYWFAGLSVVSFSWFFFLLGARP